jgi:hypothetical protein
VFQTRAAAALLHHCVHNEPPTKLPPVEGRGRVQPPTLLGPSRTVQRPAATYLGRALPAGNEARFLLVVVGDVMRK